MPNNDKPPAGEERDVAEDVRAGGERIRRAPESDDAGRVAGPGARPEDRSQQPAPEQHSGGEPPAADAVAP